jgi:hypothetical protein
MNEFFFKYAGNYWRGAHSLAPHRLRNGQNRGCATDKRGNADPLTLKLVRFQRVQKPCGIHGWFDDGKQAQTPILPFLPNLSLKKSHRMLKEKLKSYYRNWDLVYVRLREKPGG